MRAVVDTNVSGSVLLLHGLASAARSWDGFAAQLPEGLECRAPDLRGHGANRDAAAAPYSFGALALDAARLAATLPPPVTVIGHSLGGAVALLVGSGLFGVHVDRVVAIDTKVRWTEAELDRATAVAGRAPKLFTTHEEALRFWRLVAGVPAETAVDESLADAVLTTEGGSWRLSYDLAVAALGAAPVQALIALCEAEVQLVRGEDDPMVSADDIALPGILAPITVPGSGHSPHVERPEELARLLGFAGGGESIDTRRRDTGERDEYAL